jgi:mono/diheme cytochrome c family protein
MACENEGMQRFLGVLAGFGLAAALAGCKQADPPVPLGQLNPRQTHGHTVFASRCAVCHYDRKDGALHGPALIGLYKKKSLPSGAPANDERVTATVLHGRNLMPAMGNTMDQQDLDDLLAYLHTL